MSRIRDSFLFAILNLSHWKWVYTLKCIEKKSVFKMNQIVKSVFMWISQFLAGNAINMSVNCAISVHPYSGRGKSQRNWLRGRKTYDDIEIIEPISRTWIMTTSKERKKKTRFIYNCSGLDKCIYRKWYTRCGVSLLSKLSFAQNCESDELFGACWSHHIVSLKCLLARAFPHSFVSHTKRCSVKYDRKKKTEKDTEKRPIHLRCMQSIRFFCCCFWRGHHTIYSQVFCGTHIMNRHILHGSIYVERYARTHIFFFFFATIKYRTIVCLVALDKNIYMLRLFRLFGCWGEIRQPCVTHRKKPKKREIEKQPNERYACVYVVVIVVIWICAMSIYIVLSLRRLIATDWISVPSRMYTAANEHNTTHTSQQQYQYVVLQKALLLMLLLSLLL